MSTSTTLENFTAAFCGTPCGGSCATCEQSKAQLEAFFREPGETIILANVPSAPPQEQEQQLAEVIEAAQALDEADYARNTGEGADLGDGYDEEEEDDDDDDDRYGCHCLDCLNHDEPNWIYSYDDRDYGDTGLDWNESGYFD